MNFISKLNIFFKIIFVISINFSYSKAEEISIGFDKWSQNYIQKGTPLVDFISSGIERGLLLNSGEPNSRIVDEMQVSANALGWIFSISPDAIFGNGASIWLEDVLYSLQRCQKTGIIPQSYSISMRSSGAHRGNIQMSSKIPVEERAVTKGLTACPILPKAMVELLSEETFFSNTHFISAGPYIIEFAPGGDQLDLVSPKMGNLHRIHLGHEPSFEKGLSKVREGKFLAYFTSAIGVQDRIKDDTTLMVVPCESYNIVARKGLVIDCPQKIYIEEINYASS